MTVGDILSASMRLAGITQAAGRTASSAETTEALAALNGMFDAWRTERLMVYAIVRSLFSLPSSAASYTIGSGGDFNTTWPTRIETAGVLLTDGTEYPLDVVNVETFAEITRKGTESTYPTTLHYERSYPLGKVKLWPVPTDTSVQIALYLWQAMASVSSTGEAIQLPPGYQEAIEYNLAVKLAMNPRFVSRQPSALLLDMARESKATVKRMNLVPPRLMRCEDVMGSNGVWDIISGDLR